MKHLKTLLIAVGLVVAAGTPLQAANAWWGGPFAGPYAGGPYARPWGGPMTPVGPGLSKIPGWSPEEVAERYDFHGPYGPSITDVRRFHRDLWWGRPMDDLVFPMGPSPTDIRRQQRRDWYRSMGIPY
ncbi:MAG: hypothetical protein QNJ87_17105 [Gammaproteobacteria bacterium]|nr:hypothetical protein [Gammaproteobacteria bacterium]MDJ0891486.1 hypothetical protein [Gammaproteobacteria bacterium]